MCVCPGDKQTSHKMIRLCILFRVQVCFRFQLFPTIVITYSSHSYHQGTRAAPLLHCHKNNTDHRYSATLYSFMFIMATGATHVTCEHSCSCSFTRLSSKRDLQSTTARKAILFGAHILYISRPTAGLLLTQANGDWLN